MWPGWWGSDGSPAGERYSKQPFFRRSKVREIKLEVTGMTCQHCVRAVTTALERIPGVDK
ncbi:heavy-metal-associated domain-containing protein, partial [Acidithiobacillus caldus]|uniref:heavy-metal-associated domain-containing protein n=1 Tax=Acidithiobacillus caldus TaxID=33059 RepID=UPI0030B8EA00